MIAIDPWALGLSLLFLAICYLIYKWSLTIPQPEILFSNEAALPPVPKWKKLWMNSPAYLQRTAFALLLFAFIDPHLLLEKSIENSSNVEIAPTEGVAIYFVLDQSGSMTQKVGGISKIDRLKSVVSTFIKENRGNMLGIIGFARGAQVLSPLTLDQNALNEKISKFQAVANDNQDGTAIGYGIYKAANLIAATKHYAQEMIEEGTPAYEIKDSVMILVTDGIQDPNPLDEDNPQRTMDIPVAAAYAKDEGIRLYIVNVEPRLEREEFAAHRGQMQKSAESTGGKFFIAGTPDSLGDILSEINRLEKSRFPPQLEQLKNRNQTPYLFERVDFYPYLIGLALLLLFCALLIQTIWLRRVP